MSGSFFEELGIPEPDINLESGSGTQAEQTATIMVRYEKVLKENRPDLVLVVGCYFYDGLLHYRKKTE
jgi:UDP-N-acetylglucosamine 2-epimerase (non-hydrolysing)